jgi:hypothetical protein
VAPLIPNSELADIISNYSHIFHSVFEESLNEKENFIASPLGAWLLMAIIAGSNEESYTEEEHAEISSILHTSISHAYSLANELLATTHSDIAASVGAWFNQIGLISQDVTTWTNNLKNNNVVEYYDIIPTQNEIDKWTEEKTLGIMKSFPGSITERTQLLIATVLATKISWRTFFNVVPNTLETWDTQELLQAPQEHYQQLVRASSGELLGIHAATSQDGGLTVLSVVGEDDISLVDLMNEAHKIALDYGVRQEYPSVNPSEIEPQGDFWEVNAAKVTGYNVQEFVYITTLPAWEAESDHKLKDPSLQFNTIVNPLANALDTPDVEIAQAAKAAFNTNGFEAAAVTFAMFASASMPQQQTKIVYTTQINFNKPYVVVAVANHQPNQKVWKGIPVFSAVVHTAMEPEEKLLTVRERNIAPWVN